MAVKMKRILFPADFSDSSEHAFEYAIFLAKQFSARLDLLHVVEEVVFTQHVTVSVEHVDDIVDQIEVEGKKRLKELYAKRVPEGVRKTARTVRGAPFLEILRAARKNKSDLVVMGTHGRTGLSHVLMGSTAEKVVRKSPCPVLTIKHPGHHFEHP